MSVGWVVNGGGVRNGCGAMVVAAPVTGCRKRIHICTKKPGLPTPDQPPYDKVALTLIPHEVG